MNELIADKWVKALRSGEYPQGVDALQSTNSFCCLGVLCKVGELEGIKVEFMEGKLFGDDLSNQSAIKNWSSVQSNMGIFNTTEYLRNLVDINDSGEYDFNQIADLIEQTWEHI